MGDVRFHECGNGWDSLIDEAKEVVDKYNEEHPELEIPLDFLQIKEKWGILTLYLNQDIPEISDKLIEIQNKSKDICEKCGSTENVTREYTHGWIMTLCKDCREKELQK